jgi:hypothetical protein
MTRRTAAVLFAALLFAPAASAQSIVLGAADPARWDVGGQTGWTGGNKAGIGAEWDEWYEAWSGGLSAGRYITPHLKAELQATFTQRARVSGRELLVVPDAPFPIYQPQEHRFTTAMLGGGVVYQFGTNQWFHPFLGGGVDVIRERQETQSYPIGIPGRGTTVPAAPAVDRVNWAARPFANAGFKLYVTERTFFRSELRTSFSGRGAAYVTWSAGFGVDL